MDFFEHAVMACLTANGETFVVSQFDLGKGWTCPDFIAIRPPRKHAYIVEVTASGNPVELVKKVNNRERQWIAKTREHLEQRGIADAEWTYPVLVFVRADVYIWFKEKINPDTGVTIFRLEQAIASWQWEERVWTSDFLFDSHELYAWPEAK